MRRTEARTTGRTRRGVTLLEMLVVVALLVLMMTILVAIFQSALGSISAQQAYEQIDQGLRRLDQTLRSDLNGATARFTPPLNPADNLGYFEYIENAHADYQGEDSDDILAFTAKAPEGQPFVGRVWIANNDYNSFTAATSGALQTVTSDYAEIIYFLRNGNLYRRVLLIAPQRANSITVGPNGAGISGLTDASSAYGMFPYQVNALGLGKSVSWQGINDISVHPDPTGPGNASYPTASGVVFFPSSRVAGIPIPNTLGDLTNRQNRYARPRFYNDYMTAAGYLGTNGTTPPTVYPDYLPDDLNLITDLSGNTTVTPDGINDYFPSLYPSLFSNAVSYINPVTGNSIPLVYEPNGRPTFTTRVVSFDTMPFPYIYPGMYSKLPGGAAAYVPSNHPVTGAQHALDPSGATTTAINSYVNSLNGSPTPSIYPNTDNHNPLFVGAGDSLPTPTGLAATTSTYWGMPTWRETLSPTWTDPVLRGNMTKGTSFGKYNPTGFAQNAGLSWTSGLSILLPPMNGAIYTNLPATADHDLANLAFLDQPYHESPAVGNDDSANVNFVMPPTVWQDDLILTGVRSFDVKALDNAPQLYNTNTGVLNPSGVIPSAGYFDLGYNADANPNPPATDNYLTSPFVLNTFSHEGRIPPMSADHRIDPQNPIHVAFFNAANLPSEPNLGDNNNGVIRLTRTWDTWSTDYNFAPTSPLNPIDNTTGLPAILPTYPSYPPPYPAPLRGIQISIRATDARGDHIRSITIRQDFTDKL